jgi:hypothetical protein
LATRRGASGGAAALVRVRERFSADRMVRETLQVYARVLREADRPPAGVRA